MRKRYIFLVVLIIALNSTISFAAPSKWAIKEISLGQELNLIPENLLDNYQNSITREEFSEMIIKLYEAISGKIAKPSNLNPFSDTKNLEILKVYDLGIVEGVGQGKFAPNNTITREQIAVMYYRTLEAIDNSLLRGEYELVFSDKNEISNWAADSVAFMAVKGIIGGVGENKFNPKGTATREQAFALTYRVFMEFNDNKSDIEKTANEGSKPVLTAQEIGELSDSVVKIIVEEFDGGYSTGSGFFYDYGMIATNYHVIEGAKGITLEYENGSYYDDIVYITGYSEPLDIATLSIKDKKTIPIKIGDSNILKRGQKVYAIGSPEGLKNTLSDGLISAIRDEIIQITAPIYFGSSGGVLLDEFGNAIGVTSSIIDGADNIGFAIPIDYLVTLNKNNNLTLSEFYKLTYADLPSPDNVYAVEDENGDVLLSWDYMDADYFIVYESYNGEDWNELFDSYGFNEWYWDYPYCIRIYGHDPNSHVYYAVAAVKDGMMSEYSYSEELILISKLSAKELDEYLNIYSNFFTVDGVRLNFEGHFVYQSDEDETLFVYSYIDEMDYLNYLEITEKGDHNLASALKNKAVEYSKLAGGDVILTLVYSDYYYTNPLSFKNNYIYDDTVTYYKNDNCWFVWYPLVEVDNYDDYYSNWHGSFYY